MKNFSLESSSKMEKRLFETICLIQIVVIGYALVQSIVAGQQTAIIMVNLAIVLHNTFYYFLSRRNKLTSWLSWLYFVILISAAVFYWFNSAGYRGSTSVGIVGTALIIILISDNNVRRFATIILSSLIIILVWIQEKTNLIPLSGIDENTIPVTYTLIAVSIVLVISFVKNEFDTEREKVESQKSSLKDLTRKLSKMLVEKESMIDKLHQTKDQLINSEKMASIGKLTAGIAHELNNPLNYIGGVVDPLKKDIEEIYGALDEEKQKEQRETLEEVILLINQIKEGSKKANGIVKHLKKLTTPSSKSVLFTPVNLRDLLDSLANYFEQSGAHLKTSRDDADIETMGNKFELEQCLANIIQNSVEATESKSKEISMSLSRKNKSAIIIIEDKGRGISDEDLPQVLDPFFTTKKGAEAAGLGLFAAYNLLKKHSGDITIESQLGQGTKVTVELPLIA